MTRHKQKRVYINVDGKLKNIIQILYQHYGCIIPIASCEDMNDRDAYLFVTTMSMLQFNKLIDDIGVNVNIEYMAPSSHNQVPRWHISWHRDLTKEIEENLKYQLGLNNG